MRQDATLSGVGSNIHGASGQYEVHGNGPVAGWAESDNYQCYTFESTCLRCGLFKVLPSEQHCSTSQLCHQASELN